MEDAVITSVHTYVYVPNIQLMSVIYFVEHLPEICEMVYIRTYVCTYTYIYVCTTLTYVRTYVYYICTHARTYVY